MLGREGRTAMPFPMDGVPVAERVRPSGAVFVRYTASGPSYLVVSG
ncbi:hypothetical protein [Streptomyces halobius]|uniref:Uncharacterized protein n=1 Tax=Streptomyces halobius TaxID=2879846 RepID=A0ABY4MG28_9ACTN|nr:hypothetical protein [Streptomyces halobius]UQA96740.1 hypothetical protein K9S39_37075 [Streptomyces halobius]